jgi:hypothetical protein
MPAEVLNLRTRIERWADVRREVSAHRVPLTTRHAAERTAERVAHRLGIAKPRVRWLPAEVREYRGAVYPDRTDEIWIKVRHDRAAIIETVAHEVRHLWQLQDYHWLGLGLDTYELREEDAAEFGRAERRRWTGG